MSNSIINKLRSYRGYQKKSPANKLAKFIIGAELVMGGCNKSTEFVLENFINPQIRKNVATHVFNSTSSPYDATRLLLPFLKDHPQYIELVRSMDAEDLRRIQTCIFPEEPAQETNHFPRVRINNFRIDITDAQSTQSYFSDRPLSRACFFPKQRMFFDKENQQIYFLGPEQHRLCNRIGGINKVLVIGENTYVQQENQVCIVSEGKLVSMFYNVQENGLQAIERTPLGVVFGTDKNHILGEDSEPARKKRLEDVLTNTCFTVSPNTRVLYDNETPQVFVNNSEGLMCLSAKRGQTISYPNTIIIDYTIIETGDKSYMSIFSADTGNQNKPRYSFNTFGIGVARETILSGNSNYCQYRFPDNPTQNDLLWLMPRKLEDAIREKISDMK